MRKGIRTLLVAVVTTLLFALPATAGDSLLWVGIEEGGPIGGAFHEVLGPVGFIFQSGEKTRPPLDPSESITPVKETETLLAAFYERRFGPVSAGVGAAHVVRSEWGSQLFDADGDGHEEPTPIPVSRASETSPAVMVRAVLEKELISGAAEALVTSEGVVWSIRVGLAADRWRVGAGYQQGPTSDWWSGPLVFVGASW